MLIGERRCEIVNSARRAGQVSVADLSSEFGVAAETIRRDFAELERHGLVSRTHGGAVPSDRPAYDGTVLSRSEQHSAKRPELPGVPWTSVGNAQVIYLDEGSTVAAFASVLEPSSAITIVTPAIVVANDFWRRSDVSVIQLAGNLRRQSHAVIGAWTIRMLSEIAVDLAVLGTNGISLKNGFTAADPLVAEVKRTAVAQSARTMILTDSSKLGRDSFTSFAQPSDVDVLITESSAPRSMVNQIRSLGVDVLLA